MIRYLSNDEREYLIDRLVDNMNFMMDAEMCPTLGDLAEAISVCMEELHKLDDWELADRAVTAGLEPLWTE